MIFRDKKIKKYLLFIIIFLIFSIYFFIKIVKGLFFLPAIANIFHLPIPVYGYEVSLNKSSFFLGADADIKSFKEVDLSVPDYEVKDYIIVKKVLVKPGDYVYKGKVLIQLYCRELLIKKQFLSTRLANLQEEIKRKKEYMSKKENELIKQEKLLIFLREKTEKDLDQKRKFLAKAQLLYEKKYLSFFEYESLVEEVKKLEDKVYDLTVQINNINQEILQTKKLIADEIFNLNQQISTLNYELKLLNQKIDKTNIRSPIDGFVNNLFVQPGQYVNLGYKLLTISDISKLKVIAHVPAIYLGRLFRGQKAFVKINNLNFEFETKIEAIYPIINSKTQTFDVELYLNNKNKKVLPGATAFVRFETKKRLLLIPKFCVTGLPDTPIVFIIKNGKALARKVILGDFFPFGMVEIKYGLTPGDIVIKSALRYINDGKKVRLLGIEKGNIDVNKS